MFRPIYFTLVLLLISHIRLAAQDTLSLGEKSYLVKSHDLIIGNHLVAGDEDALNGSPFYFLELGYARSLTAQKRYSGDAAAVFSVTQAMAINREFVTATRVGMSIRAWLASLGLNLSYYTDFEYGNLKISPELGMGFPHFKAVMGLNIPTAYNDDFDDFSYGLYQFTLNFNLPLAKKQFALEETMAP